MRPGRRRKFHTHVLLKQVKVPTLVVLAPARSPLTPLTEQVMIRD
jgi:hypothetical protein